MGMQITADELAPIPRQITLRLICDAPEELRLPIEMRLLPAVFRSPSGFVGAHTAAMAAGWLERHTDKGRVWLCPDCSGKPALPTMIRAIKRDGLR